MTLLGPAKCQLSWDCNNGIGKWYFICTQGCKHLCTHTWKDTMNRNQSTQTCTLCSPGVPNEQVITQCTCAHTYEGMSSSPLSQQRDVNQPTESQIYDSRSGWSPLSSNWLIHVFQTAHMSYIIPTGHTMSGHKVPSWGWNRWSWQESCFGISVTVLNSAVPFSCRIVWLCEFLQRSSWHNCLFHVWKGFFATAKSLSWSSAPRKSFTAHKFGSGW